MNWPPLSWASSDEIEEGMQPPEELPGWSRMAPPWEEDVDYFLRETGYFTPTIDSDEEEEVPPPSCVHSVLKEMPKPQPLSPETLRRISWNRAAALRRKDAIAIALKEKQPPLLNVTNKPLSPETMRRISANRAAALKRKQELGVDMTDFTPRCRKQREISEHAENLEHDLTTGKPPVHPASKQQSTAPQIPNCNCIQCAGVLAKPIVAKCVICDEPVIYSICAMHYPNTLQFHIEVQNRSRSVICFNCKSAI
jgi:hypothetical protein